MDCTTTTDILEQAWATARLAIAGGIIAIGALMIYGVARIMDRWRRWQQ